MAQAVGTYVMQSCFAENRATWGRSGRHQKRYLSCSWRYLTVYFFRITAPLFQRAISAWVSKKRFLHSLLSALISLSSLFQQDKWKIPRMSKSRTTGWRNIFPFWIEIVRESPSWRENVSRISSGRKISPWDEIFTVFMVCNPMIRPHIGIRIFLGVIIFSVSFSIEHVVILSLSSIDRLIFVYNSRLQILFGDIDSGFLHTIGWTVTPHPVIPTIIRTQIRAIGITYWQSGTIHLTILFLDIISDSITFWKRSDISSDLCDML